jgi:diguanylate cyclase (GGDEF)-like protein
MDDQLAELMEFLQELRASVPNQGANAEAWMHKAHDFSAACLSGDGLRPALEAVIPLRRRGEMLRALKVIFAASELFQGQTTEIQHAISSIDAILKAAQISTETKNTWLDAKHAVDDLLPLAPRKVLDIDLPQAVKECSRSKPLALLMLDLDHFKNVNDTYGHQVGDEVLIAASETVQAHVGRKGKAYRYGGEELTVLLPNVSTDEGRATAERIRRSISDLRFSETALRTTVSIGLAACSDPSTAPEGLLKRADEALYRAKNSGRDTVVIAGEAEEPKPSITPSGSVSQRLEAVIQATPRERGTNGNTTTPKQLRIKRKFTDRERDEFLDEAFESIAKYFEQSLHDLSVQNPHAEGRFKRIDATHFDGSMYVDGDRTAYCRIWRGRPGGFGSGIGYSTNPSSSDNSYNEMLDVRDDGYSITLAASMGSSRGREDAALLPEKAAEYLWNIFVEHLQR